MITNKPYDGTASDRSSTRAGYSKLSEHDRRKSGRKISIASATTCNALHNLSGYRSPPIQKARREHTGIPPTRRRESRCAYSVGALVLVREPKFYLVLSSPRLVGLP